MGPDINELDATMTKLTGGVESAQSVGSAQSVAARLAAARLRDAEVSWGPSCREDRSAPGQRYDVPGACGTCGCPTRTASSGVVVSALDRHTGSRCGVPHRDRHRRSGPTDRPHPPRLNPVLSLRGHPR